MVDYEMNLDLDYIPIPCVGCGYCCLKVKCMLAALKTGTSSGPCPYLTWGVSRYWCKLAQQDTHHAEQLGIGKGCCSPMNSWRKEVKKR